MSGWQRSANNSDKMEYVRKQRAEKLSAEQGRRRKQEEIAKARMMKEKIRNREIAMRLKREKEEKERRARQAAEYKRRLKEERSKQIVAGRRDLQDGGGGNEVDRAAQGNTGHAGK